MFFLKRFFPEHSLIAAHNRLKDPAPGRVLLICGLLSHKNGLPAELLLGIDQDLSLIHIWISSTILLRLAAMLENSSSPITSMVVFRLPSDML